LASFVATNLLPDKEVINPCRNLCAFLKNIHFRPNTRLVAGPSACIDDKRCKFFNVCEEVMKLLEQFATLGIRHIMIDPLASMVRQSISAIDRAVELGFEGRAELKGVSVPVEHVKVCFLVAEGKVLGAEDFDRVMYYATHS